MVPLSERDTVTQRAKSDAEMRAVYAFVFEESFDFSTETSFAHADLLRALATNDADAFQLEVSGYKKRRTSEGSGWYDNDSLIFLLLVGCERFEIAPQFLDPILTARERNTNPIPKQVNEVFRALARKDYGTESPFGFLKLPLLQLAGKLKLSTNAATKVYNELTKSGNFGLLTPFLQLLALRAYDLVLLQRRPQPFEDFDALVESLESYQERASIGQAAKLLCALPYRWWIGSLSIACVALSFVFGLGQRVPEKQAHRQRPIALSLISRGDARHHSLPAVRGMANQYPANEHAYIVAVETAPLSTQSGKFSLEASTNTATLQGAQAWLVRPTEAGNMQSYLPVQQGLNSSRAFIETAEAGDYIIFVLCLRSSPAASFDQVAGTIVLRALD